MSMRIGDYANISAGHQNNTSKYNSVREYSNYLMGKYSCLKPGNNVTVSVTGGLMRKAMADEETGAWLERELSKAPDYIAAAQKAAIAHGSTLKSVSIEFGEEYSTMTTVGVFGDEGGTDPEIDKWLEKIKENQANKKKETKMTEKQDLEPKLAERNYGIEVKGNDLEELTKKFAKKLSMIDRANETDGFDVRC